MVEVSCVQSVKTMRRKERKKETTKTNTALGKVSEKERWVRPQS
jgi:hypothetical protein